MTLDALTVKAVKVYVVIEIDSWESVSIKKIFLSRELAEDCAFNNLNLFVEEHLMDLSTDVALYTRVVLTKKKEENKMFEDFAESVLKAEVTTRGNHLKNCAGLAIVTGIREDSDRSGKKAVMDLLLVKVDPRDPNDTNYVGEKVSRQYRFQDGDADKRAAVLANFKRDLCALSDIDARTMTGDQFKAMAQAAAKGNFKGIMLRFDPYSAVTKKGAARVYHNLSKVQGQNTAADIAKRAKLLTEGAGVEAFV